MRFSSVSTPSSSLSFYSAFHQGKHHQCNRKASRATARVAHTIYGAAFVGERRGPARKKGPCHQGNRKGCPYHIRAAFVGDGDGLNWGVIEQNFFFLIPHV